MDRSSPRPNPEFSRDEMLYLQQMVNIDRCRSFNSYMLALENGESSADKLFAKYQISRSVRDKVYHMTGRDTLAPIGIHEQRHWDQQHDYGK